MQNTENLLHRDDTPEDKPPISPEKVRQEFFGNTARKVPRDILNNWQGTEFVMDKFLKTGEVVSWAEECMIRSFEKYYKDQFSDEAKVIVELSDAQTAKLHDRYAKEGEDLYREFCKKAQDNSPKAKEEAEALARHFMNLYSKVKEEVFR